MITKIVLTGGPGSGKTTILNSIKEEYTKRGYTVLLVDETATSLINSGLKPFGSSPLDINDFQELVLKLQLMKEEFYSFASHKFLNDQVLIIYDRGILDNSAYISESEFTTILNNINKDLNIPSLIRRYDLVIGLIGSKDFYTTSNNNARTEDVSTALKLGTNTLNSWLYHDHLKLVTPKATITEKSAEVISIIDNYLEKRNCKNQAKFLIDLQKIDMTYLESISKKSFITQDYLQSFPNIEKRIRKEIIGPTTTYYYTIYKQISITSKVIIESSQISPQMYAYLLGFKDENYEQITKIRYYFNHEGLSMHLDIFTNNNEYGLAEINNPCQNYLLPSFLPELKYSSPEILNNQNIARKKENISRKLTP